MPLDKRIFKILKSRKGITGQQVGQLRGSSKTHAFRPRNLENT